MCMDCTVKTDVFILVELFFIVVGSLKSCQGIVFKLYTLKWAVLRYFCIFSKCFMLCAVPIFVFCILKTGCNRYIPIIPLIPPH